MSRPTVAETWPGRLLLLQCPNRLVDFLVTVAAAAVVVWSRFALLANGPWEWDEVAFARGVLEFDLAAYFPHPPGYPAWLAVGHLLNPFAGEPMVALQWGSAAFSVIALWVLAALGRRVAPAPVALAAALVVLAAPGPWLYAVRGFSSTAASVLALSAALVVSGGLDRRRVTIFSILITASFLVRPNILPPLGMFWLGVALWVRPWKKLWPGVAIGSAMVTVAVAFMAWAEGGLGPFVAPYLSHSQRHFSRLDGNVGGYADLGLVKGLGGALPASVLLVLAMIGVVVWARRINRRSAGLWLAVLLVAAGQLVWMQNRTYCRYAVGVQMALAPLVAGAVAAAPPAAGCAGLLMLAGWLGSSSLPVVEEQHSSQLAGWRAVQEAREQAANHGETVVIESELHLFASYHWKLLQERGHDPPPKVLSPWDPGTWTGVDQPYRVATVHRGFYPDSLFGARASYFGGASDRLWPLTQQRFLQAWVIDNPPLPLNGWWTAERLPSGRRFMWGGAGAEMLLPPLPPGTSIGMVVRPAPGPAPLAVVVDGREVARFDGEDPEQKIVFALPADAAGRPVQLSFDRARGYPPNQDDQRPLAVQLFELRAYGPEVAWTADLTLPWQRDALSILLEGAYPAEDFARSGRGMWLAPRAGLELPAGPGRLAIRLAAPRPISPETVVLVSGREAAGPLDLTPEAEWIELRVLAEDVVGGRVAVEIVSQSYTPADSGGNDSRRLGVVLSLLRFEP